MTSKWGTWYVHIPGAWQPTHVREGVDVTIIHNSPTCTAKIYKCQVRARGCESTPIGCESTPIASQRGTNAARNEAEGDGNDGGRAAGVHNAAAPWFCWGYCCKNRGPSTEVGSCFRPDISATEMVLPTSAERAPLTRSRLHRAFGQWTRQHPYPTLVYDT